MGDTVYSDFQGFNIEQKSTLPEYEEQAEDFDYNDLKFDQGAIYNYLDSSLNPNYTHVVMCYPYFGTGNLNTVFEFGKIGITILLQSPEHMVKSKFFDYHISMFAYASRLIKRLQEGIHQRIFNHFETLGQTFLFSPNHRLFLKTNASFNPAIEASYKVFIPQRKEEYIENANGCFQYVRFKKAIMTYHPTHYFKGYTIKTFENELIIKGIGLFFSGYTNDIMEKDTLSELFKREICELAFRDRFIAEIKDQLERIFIHPKKLNIAATKRKRQVKKLRKRIPDPEEEDGATALQRAIAAASHPNRILPPISTFYSATDRAVVRNEGDIFEKRDRRRKRRKITENRYFDVEAKDDGNYGDDVDDDGMKAKNSKKIIDDDEEDIYIDVMAEDKSDTSKPIGKDYEMEIIQNEHPINPMMDIDYLLNPESPTGGNALRNKAKSLPSTNFNPSMSRMPTAFRTRVYKGQLYDKKNVNFQLDEGEGEYLYRDPKRSIFPANTWQFGDPYEYYIPSPIKRNEKLNYTPFSLPTYI